mmetsp:Transcript_26689/g.48938  ORF Transcript_26689/g.48938 Transcript_26689/m.48938 type:complete len:344 (-) Transcript_26689:16-1047(-)
MSLLFTSSAPPLWMVASRAGTMRSNCSASAIRSQSSLHSLVAFSAGFSSGPPAARFPRMDLFTPPVFGVPFTLLPPFCSAVLGTMVEAKRNELGLVGCSSSSSGPPPPQAGGGSAAGCCSDGCCGGCGCCCGGGGGCRECTAPPAVAGLRPSRSKAHGLWLGDTPKAATASSLLSAFTAQARVSLATHNLSFESLSAAALASAFAPATAGKVRLDALVLPAEEQTERRNASLDSSHSSFITCRCSVSEFPLYTAIACETSESSLRCPAPTGGSPSTDCAEGRAASRDSLLARAILNAVSSCIKASISSGDAACVAMAGRDGANLRLLPAQLCLVIYPIEASMF